MSTLKIFLIKNRLNKLEKRIGSFFKKTKSHIYHKDKNRFYVYAKPNLYDKAWSLSSLPLCLTSFPICFILIYEKSRKPCPLAKVSCFFFEFKTHIDSIIDNPDSYHSTGFHNSYESHTGIDRYKLHECFPTSFR